MCEIDDLLSSFFATLPGTPDHVHISDDGAQPIYDHAGDRWPAELNRWIEATWLNLAELEKLSERERCQRMAMAIEARRRAQPMLAARAEVEQQRADAWRAVPQVTEHYAVTVDRIPPSLHCEIVRNRAQIEAWRTQLAVDAPDDLSQHPHLVVDTRHFDEAFRNRLLKALGNFDSQLDGIAIHGENFAALTWLAAQHVDPIRCVFIDPPYNTGSGVWTYDDRLARETWRVMMRDRLRAAHALLSDDGAMFVSLDDHEHATLHVLMEEVFGAENFLATIIWEKVHTRKNSARHFSVSHDYIPAFSKDRRLWKRELLPREETSAYTNPDDDPRGPWKLDPVYANKPYAADYTIRKPNGVVLHRPSGRYWRFSRETFDQKAADGAVVWGEDDAWPMVKRYLADVQDGLVPTTLFTREFAGDNARANAELAAMFGRSRPVSYPKPSLLVRRIVQIATSPTSRDTVLDFFAGSGTTAQAVIDQNRIDQNRSDRTNGVQANRRWIVVEKDDVFDTVLVPRIVKSVYSDAWKDGKPVAPRGVSQLFKIVKLRA
jgi:adenine-specific DNA-methyltransferase